MLYSIPNKEGFSYFTNDDSNCYFASCSSYSFDDNAFLLPYNSTFVGYGEQAKGRCCYPQTAEQAAIAYKQSKATPQGSDSSIVLDILISFVSSIFFKEIL